MSIVFYVWSLYNEDTVALTNDKGGRYGFFEYLCGIDFCAFLDFPTTCTVRNRPRVKIFEDGRVSLCGELRKRTVEQQRDYCARISPDGRCIALYPERTPNIHFHADGSSMRHERLLQLLRDREIQLPAVYEMEWYEPENAWVGCCSDLPEPDVAAIRQSVKKAGGRRKQ